MPSCSPGSLCGYSVFAMVRFLLHANSKSRSPLSFVFPRPNLTTVPVQSLYTSSPIFASRSPMIMVISFYRVLEIVSSSVS